MVAVPIEQAHSPPDVDEFFDVPKSVRALWRLPMYSEARTWFQWTNVFTPSDIADLMGINVEVAQRLTEAAVYHRIVTREDFDGQEHIYEYVPLPPGPRFHPVHQQPERMVGYDEVLCARGMPVRIRTERDQRKSMSTPGARGHINRREQRYHAMQAAVDARRKKQAEKAGTDEWRKVKKKSKAVQ